MNDERKLLYELIERCDEIGRFGDYDYSWWEFVAWYDPQARIYYWFEDAGCSCYGFMDGADSISELSCGRKEELLHASRESGSGNAEGWSDFMSALRDHKPN